MSRSAPVRKVFDAASAVGVLSFSSLFISLATFISVPVLMRRLGAETWVMIALAQAFGEIGRVVVVWGWNSIGLAIVAPMSPAERLGYYFRSLPPRVVLLVPTSLVLAGVLLFVGPGSLAVTVPVALAGAVYGLTGGWLFIAAGEPSKMVMLDAVPRALSIVLGTLAVAVYPSGELFGVVCLMGSAVAVTLPLIVARRRARGMELASSWGGVRDILTALRFGIPVVGSVLVMVMRFSAVILTAPFLAPNGLGAVALGDKFFRWANTAITPVFQTAIVRIPRLSGDARRRVLVGVVVAWIGGAVLFAGTIPVVVLGSSLLSDGAIDLTLAHAAPIAVAVMAVFVSAITGNCLLIMLGRRGSLLTTSVLGLVVLGVCLAALAPVFGAVGMFWAFAIAEMSVCITQHAIIFSALKRRRRLGERGSVRPSVR